MSRDPVRVALALLLVLSAGLFITGAILEHGHKETGTKHTEVGGETGSEGSAAPTPAETTKGSERLFGLDLERPGIVAMTSVVTLALAAVALGWRDRRALWLILLFAVPFAVLDVREAVHQSNEHRTSLLAIASILIAIHVITALLAGARARGNPQVSGVTV